MRSAWVATVVLVFYPGFVSAQGSSVHAGAGPTLVDAGHHLSAAVGFSPLPRVTLVAEAQRTQLSTRSTQRGRDSSHFRGGTVTAASAEVRLAFWPAGRVTPYVLTGAGVGVSRPTVNEVFPNRVSNDVRFMFAGAGVQIPLRERLSLFGDPRVLIGAEAGEMLAIIPTRVGVAWRF